MRLESFRILPLAITPTNKVGKEEQDDRHTFLGHILITWLSGIPLARYRGPKTIKRNPHKIKVIAAEVRAI